MLVNVLAAKLTLVTVVNAAPLINDKPPVGLAAANVKLLLSDAAVRTSPGLYVVNGIGLG